MQRDRVRFERRPSDQTHRQGGGDKDPDLRGDHQPDRQAEPPQRRELACRGPPWQSEQPQAEQARVDQREGDQQREHQRLRQRGGEARADDAERRQPELAENERVIRKSVEDDRDETGKQRQARTLERRERRSAGDEHETGREPPLERRHVAAGVQGERRGGSPIAVRIAVVCDSRPHATAAIRRAERNA